MGRWKKTRKKKPIFMGDFETTVYENQERTDVWASALTRIGDETDHVEVFNSLPATYDWLIDNVKSDCIIYYHNLKFDGTFFLAYLMERGDYVECFDETDPMVLFEGTSLERKMKQGEFEHDKDMPPGSYKYLISDMGAWYNVKFKRHDGFIVELRDSLKLIPCSVRKMANDFQTKHQKTEIEYTGYREPGGYISPEEREYIANDVLVVKEVLEFMFANGHDKLTIGACGLAEFKSGFYKSQYEEMFPKLEDVKIDESIYGDRDADEYIRRSYHGGWCYVKESIKNEPMGAGITLDVNSLYPGTMLSKSGNRFPIGFPKFFQGIGDFNRIKDDKTKYYFVRVKTRFYLKEGFLPFIQIKRNKLYTSTEMLKTSDVYDEKTGKYHKYLLDENGEMQPTRVIITFSKSDWELVQEHYNLTECEILDGCWFYTTSGMYDKYLLKYKQQKETSKGAKRQLAKNLSNTLYGKMSAGTNSSFKRLYPDEYGAITSETIFECKKEAGYIADGAAITSAARAKTVRAAQANYDVFCYSDTDSIHLCCSEEDVVGCEIHDTEYGCWKVESHWDSALFVRQKTYAEHIVMKDGEPVEEPYWDIKCAGLPQKCKNLLQLSIKGLDTLSEEEYNKVKDTLTEREFKFVSQKRDITDFKVGLRIPGKLLPVNIPGGTVLADVDFTMH